MNGDTHHRPDRPVDPALEPAPYSGPDSGPDTEPDSGPDTGRRPRRRRRAARMTGLALGVLVLAGSGTAAGYWLNDRNATADTRDTPAGPADTAEVTRATLTATDSFGGTLGHGGAHTVAAQGPGTVTGLAQADTALERGEELYRVDERPVTAFFGEIPMFRDLRAGDVGTDVEQLEHNLAALGYGGEGFAADEEYTAETEEAVRAWQADLDVPETGVAARAALVFVPNGARVDGLHAEVGDVVAPGTPVLDVTGSEQVVSLDVGMEDRDLLPVDAEVTVELPDGRTVAGTVTATSVSSQGASGASGSSGAAGASGSSGAGGGEEAAGSDDAVAHVEVSLAEEVDASLLGSPVDVVATLEEREDVLVVPVSALLARPDGGYGLEVVAADGTTSVVPVEAGLFADGLVEIVGGSVEEGAVVGVAGR
ncbi:peptidoglycan-binding protein [Streptomyces sp. 4N509B]|uniref:peptidoglycan-binding protein n=1 Tax=Streptomyces sp. 4N509B TaxID=3457413 RepID=UPI003FD4660B